jgi:3-dehydroquinate synthase
VYEVSASSGSYPGYVGWGIIPSLGWHMKEAGLGGTAHIIADSTVFDLYGQQVVTSLNEAGFATESFRLPPGEAIKTLEHAGHLYQWLASRRAERGHCIVAIGGGVAGDLAGFVAATYLRGMPVVQVPTTLLSMVDASIGGKTAVNLPEGKNLVGAFHQPRLVLADVETLASLPERELRSGWAELVKSALILDHALFAFLDQNLDPLRSLHPELFSEAITRSAAIKARVVTTDEKETSGFRALLNYGHTIGHALESVLSYEGLLHGEAVAIGMTAAAEIAVRMGMLDPGTAAVQRRIIEAFGLPVQAPPVDLERVRSAIALDKKVVGKRINWVLLEEIGRAVTRNDVPDEIVDAALAAVVAT